MTTHQRRLLEYLLARRQPVRARELPRLLEMKPGPCGSLRRSLEDQGLLSCVVGWVSLTEAGADEAMRVSR